MTTPITIWLLEGDAGVGKTEVAKVVAGLQDARLIRLQCYEGLDVNQAVYEWNYQHQLLAIKLLEAGDYWGYNQHCVSAKSDARDAGQVFRYLCGPMKGRILDLTYSDATELYEAEPPTWVDAPYATTTPARRRCRCSSRFP